MAHSNIYTATPSQTTCWQHPSKTDVILLSIGVVLLTIAILASQSTVFHFVGTTNAIYLSYGMFAGAALFFGAEGIKILFN